MTRENGKMRCEKKLAAGAVAVMILILAAALPASAARPPAGRTYFVISMGTEIGEGEEFTRSAGCVRFTATEFCQEDQCGTWTRTMTEVQTPKETSFAFSWILIDEETGLAVEIDGEGRIDSRGRKDALAAVARGVIAGEQRNFAFAGRSVPAARCPRLVAAFEAANP